MKLNFFNYLHTLSYAPWKAEKGERLKAAALGLATIGILPLLCALVAGGKWLVGRVKRIQESSATAQIISRNTHQAAMAFLQGKGVAHSEDPGAAYHQLINYSAKGDRTAREIQYRMMKEGIGVDPDPEKAELFKKVCSKNLIIKWPGLGGKGFERKYILLEFSTVKQAQTAHAVLVISGRLKGYQPLNYGDTALRFEFNGSTKESMAFYKRILFNRQK